MGPWGWLCLTIDIPFIRYVCLSSFYITFILSSIDFSRPLNAYKCCIMFYQLSPFIILIRHFPWIWAEKNTICSSLSSEVLPDFPPLFRMPKLSVPAIPWALPVLPFPSHQHPTLVPTLAQAPPMAPYVRHGAVQGFQPPSPSRLGRNWQ